MGQENAAGITLIAVGRIEGEGIAIPVTLLDTGLNGEYAQMVSYEYAARIEPASSNP